MRHGAPCCDTAKCRIKNLLAVQTVSTCIYHNHGKSNIGLCDRLSCDEQDISTESLQRKSGRPAVFQTCLEKLRPLSQCV